MAISLKPPHRGGVVTFLDVLGWKGIYGRKPDAIPVLSRLIEQLKATAETAVRGRILEKPEIKSISDTIAIFTFCPEGEAPSAIELHGELCQWLIPLSIESEIPVRGATSFGDFEIRDSIFVGKAIDEAASWHEQSDWIGVHLTPSAEYIFEPKPATVWVKYGVPSKTRVDWKPHCVNWTAGWTDRATQERMVKLKFRSLGPIVPEITGKFANTLAFIDNVAPPGAARAADGN